MGKQIDSHQCSGTCMPSEIMRQIMQRSVKTARMPHTEHLWVRFVTVFPVAHWPKVVG